MYKEKTTLNLTDVKKHDDENLNAQDVVLLHKYIKELTETLEDLSINLQSESFCNGKIAKLSILSIEHGARTLVEKLKSL